MRSEQILSLAFLVCTFLYYISKKLVEHDKFSGYLIYFITLPASILLPFFMIRFYGNWFFLFLCINIIYSIILSIPDMIMHPIFSIIKVGMSIAIFILMIRVSFI